MSTKHSQSGSIKSKYADRFIRFCQFVHLDLLRKMCSINHTCFFLRSDMSHLFWFRILSIVYRKRKLLSFLQSSTHSVIFVFRRDLGSPVFGILIIIHNYRWDEREIFIIAHRRSCELEVNIKFDKMLEKL